MKRWGLAVSILLLEIGVRRPDLARELLTAAGLEIGTDGEFLVLPKAQIDTAVRANRLLLAGGIDVYHLNLRAPSLEETFLELTTPLSEETCIH